MDINDAKLREVLTKTIKERMGDVNIVSLRVEEDSGGQDETVLRVYVVYEAKEGKLDSSKVSGLLRRLRPALSDVGEGRFPVMSFISKGDAEGHYAGAA